MTDHRGPRIVSLVPAGTEIVAALGALDLLVGISHECDFPAEIALLPRVTGSAVDSTASSTAIDDGVRELAARGAPVFAIDAAVLKSLAPDLILTQALCEVCAVDAAGVHSLANVLSRMPSVVSLNGRTLGDVWSDIRLVGEFIDRETEANALVASLDERLLAVHRALKTARAPRPRTVVIEWLDPVFVAGHWTPDVVRRAGGSNLLAEPGSHSVTITAAAIHAADPELLVFAPCGFDVERAERDARALLSTDEWAWVWTGNRQCWALDGNALTSRPGPRLADAIQVLASIVAPSLFPPSDAGYARRITN